MRTNRDRTTYLGNTTPQGLGLLDDYIEKRVIPKILTLNDRDPNRNYYYTEEPEDIQKVIEVIGSARKYIGFYMDLLLYTLDYSKTEVLYANTNLYNVIGKELMNKTIERHLAFTIYRSLLYDLDKYKSYGEKCKYKLHLEIALEGYRYRYQTMGKSEYTDGLMFTFHDLVIDGTYEDIMLENYPEKVYPWTPYKLLEFTKYYAINKGRLFICGDLLDQTKKAILEDPYE